MQEKLEKVKSFLAHAEPPPTTIAQWLQLLPSPPPPRQRHRANEGEAEAAAAAMALWRRRRRRRGCRNGKTVPLMLHPSHCLVHRSPNLPTAKERERKNYKGQAAQPSKRWSFISSTWTRDDGRRRCWISTTLWANLQEKRTKKKKKAMSCFEGRLEHSL